MLVITTKHNKERNGTVKKRNYFLFILFLTVFISACASGKEVDADKEFEEAEQAYAIPEDEELLDLFAEHVEAFNEKDIETYMEAIHPDSPSFEASREHMESLKDINVELEINVIYVEDKDETTVNVYIEQDTYFHDAVGKNNRFEATHELRRHGHDWKVYSTSPINQVAIDENGEEVEVSEEDILLEELENESVEDIEGEYADFIKDIDLSTIEEDLTFYSYEEDVDYGILTFIFSEDLDRQLTVEVLADEAGPNVIEDYAYNVESNYGIEGVETRILEQDDNQLIYTVSFPEEMAGYPEHVQVGKAYIDGNNLNALIYTEFEKHELEDDDIDAWVDNLEEIE